MWNSAVAALAHPVLHAIRIPIHQTKQLGAQQNSRTLYCIVAISERTGSK